LQSIEDLKSRRKLLLKYRKGVILGKETGEVNQAIVLSV